MRLRTPSPIRIGAYFLVRWVSEKRKNSRHRLRSVASPAMMKGSEKLYSESFPPKIGPTVKPTPQVMLYNPKCLPLFSGVLKSAMVALTTATFPDASPIRNLEEIKMMTLSVNTPSVLNAYPTTPKIRLKMKTGLRPF